MTVSSANYIFLPWVRQGAASGIQRRDDLKADQPGVVSVPVNLQVNKAVDVGRQVHLYGPGDVTAIDPLQVIRTEPRHLANDFEPNYFPAIEFDRPDFPWLFTPAKADDSGKLRPWLCLVVVRKQKGVTLSVDPKLPLPVLEIKSPAEPKNELPDLAESWVWTHAQVTGSRPEEGSLKQSLTGNPALTLSRLLCPRRLDPLTDYLACVVPTFELGSKAGLGDPFVADAEKFLKPAWESGERSPSEVKLPVYYRWEFRTGTGADFEALVGLLEARDALDMPPQIGKKRIDISEPGFLLSPPLPSDTILELEGALRLVDGPPVAEWAEQTRKPFRDELKKILEIPWLVMKQGGIEPLVAPPIYGCWQAARHTLETSATPPAILPWLDELNLDPRHRGVAALGTAVVQTQQEQLMASAWEQLGEIERINQLRRQAQLGRSVNAVYHIKHFSRFSDETLLKLVAPAQSRLVVETVGTTIRVMLSQKISQSALPDRAISATMRRLTSPRGVISARFQLAGAAPMSIVAPLLTLAPIIAFQRTEGGVVTLNQVTDEQTGTASTQLKQVVRFDRILDALTTAPQLGDFSIVPEGFTPKRNLLSFNPPGSPDSDDAKNFREAAKALQNYLTQSSTGGGSSQLTRLSPIDMRETRDALIRSINPERTITARVQKSLEISGELLTGGDPLEPILDAPDFPQPMYEGLRDLSQDFLFPGLEHVPQNTITLLGTNPKFVESFMIGLNEEMGREFLWRNYPTDQRGTFFRQFWDRSAGEEQPDIERIHEWDDKTGLGDNARGGESLVLLIRGELLRRYPNSVIYAVAAVEKDGKLDLSTDPAKELHPLFRGTLKPDVTFLGFNLEKTDATADPGFFFVIQQQPTEPRFGMDVADFEKDLPDLNTWNDLSWRHLATTKEKLNELTHASIKTVLQANDTGEWGRNSAHQAYITLQRPVRIAIHAREMLKG
jgi:hypothetical protein